MGHDRSLNAEWAEWIEADGHVSADAERINTLAFVRLDWVT